MKKEKEDRNIYMFTPAGWQHLGTGKVVESGGIPLDAEDVQALKELYLEEEDEKEGKEVNSDQ
ncbi:hypothetical protein C6499_22780 [Candidatus Poribacteria bacterium]|nr:MAG: hypothetical protein C6499_22780 [Candidatus Poribacteria bacterium]